MGAEDGGGSGRGEETGDKVINWEVMGDGDVFKSDNRQTE